MFHHAHRYFFFNYVTIRHLTFGIFNNILKVRNIIQTLEMFFSTYRDKVWLIIRIITITTLHSYFMFHYLSGLRSRNPLSDSLDVLHRNDEARIIIYSSVRETTGSL